MTANPKLRKATYWVSVNARHRINDNGQFELTEEAPPREIESFRIWCEINCVKQKDE